MQRLEHHGREFWFGLHRKLGPMIFDPTSQAGMEVGQVRLFRLEERRSSTFSRSVVRNAFVAFSEEDLNRHQAAIDSYISARVNSRATHCFKCKISLGSTDFALCQNCGWIQCSCGACGCSYSTSGG